MNPNEKSTSNQRKQILAYLQSGNQLTSLEALQKFNCLRLSARIHELKKSHSVQSVWTWRGEKQVKLYYMQGDNND